ncbi:hypothetical protein LBMAG53_37910 [Planctomycetota bacterium]|nr:hypothetical protein LBMAG53_37910 [Planctomycetota bacterium]
MVGCADARFPAGLELATEPAAVSRFDTGRRLYLNRCSGCHALIPPEQISADRWPAEVARMAKRSVIDSAQQQAITDYLVAVSSR